MGIKTLVCSLIAAQTCLFIPFNKAHAFNLFDGFIYINGGAGAIGIKSNMDAYTTLTTPSHFYAVNNTVHAGDANWIAAIGFGYFYPVSERWTLGIEVVGDVEGPNAQAESFLAHSFVINDRLNTETFLAGKATTKIENSIAILFKPRYFFTPTTAIYALVGPRWGNIQTITEGTYFLSYNNAFYSLILPETKETGYTSALSLGLGTEWFFYDEFSIALEWNYSYYGHVSSPKLENLSLEFDDTFEHELSQYLKTDKVRTNSILVKVAYTFT